MDRMVDHLFAFEGDGVIRDYPGNYSQYREALANNLLTDERQLIKEVPKPTKEISAQATTTEGKKGLTFNEKREG